MPAANTGWSFCSSSGVVGSPCLKASVKSTVAATDEPPPISASATQSRRESVRSVPAAGMTSASAMTASSACSQNTTSTVGRSSARPRRKSASVPQSAAPAATRTTPGRASEPRPRRPRPG